MDLRHVEIFVAVAEAGSFHSAARRLRMSQPGISQAMRKLERSVGVPLLIRSTRGVEPSEAGGVFLKHAHNILREIDVAVDTSRRVASRRHPLAIGLLAGRLGAAELTPIIVTEFRRAHPDLDVSIIELSFADQFEAVREGLVDVAIVRPPTEDGSIENVPLFSEPRVLCMSADNPMRGEDDPISLERALELPVLRMGNVPERWSGYWELEELRRPSGFHRSAAVTVSELQLGLADSPCALSVAQSGWRMAIESPYLNAIPLEEAEPSVACVSFLLGRRTSEVQSFVELARQVTKQNITLVEGASVIG